MARYIDADLATLEIEQAQENLLTTNDALWEMNKKYFKGLAWAHAIVDEIPTANVAPRADVARGIFEEIEKIRLKEIHRCEAVREKEHTHTQRNYWEGGANSLRQISYWIADLKKKYESENNNG